MSKVGLPAAGTVQLVSAMPIERVAALTRSPRAFRAARSRPSSAAAPRIFSTMRMPALHEWRMLADVHKVGMRRAESGKAFVHHILGGVDQLLHSGLPVLVASASAVLDQPCDFLRELAQERVKLVVLLFAPQIRQHQCETPAALRLFQEHQPPRLRLIIAFEKPPPFLIRLRY